MKLFTGTLIKVDDNEEVVLVKDIPKSNNFKVILRDVDITSRVKAIVSKELSYGDITEHLEKVGVDTKERLVGKEDINPISNQLDEG